MSIQAQAPPRVSPLRQLVNILGCIFCLPMCWAATVHCRWPVTLDFILTVTLTELNRYVNEGRRMALREPAGGRPLSPPSPMFKEKMDDPEKGTLAIETIRPVGSSRLDCLASVVGWREDPDLFTRALESYKASKGCVFLLVGIDGDEAQDMEMVDVFNAVYPSNSATIHIPKPLGEVAQELRSKEVSMRRQQGQPVDLTEIDRMVMSHCLDLARRHLSQAGVHFSGPDATSQLCIRQRHMHKKGVMFSTYVFSLVIADALGVEFLWSSDSDTLVLPDSLSRSVESIAVDPSIGGASTALILHNRDDGVIAKLAETVYWGELYLTRSMPAATATSDCQSGPSTLFRLSAMPSILVPWYLQTIWGKRMIINEDRHLTTNLLLRGWGVVFASDVAAATDTPTTMARWLRQQVRWGRATHIESLLQPKIYPMNHPLLFFSMAKRESGPVVAWLAVVYYFFTSKTLITMEPPDLLVRCIAALAYNMLRNPHRLRTRSLKWVIPGVAFYHIPLPAVHVWSMLTLTADGWGTSMRASGERAKKESVRQAWFETGFFVVWMGVVAGCLAKWLSSSVFVMSSSSFSLFFVASMASASYAAWRLTVRQTC
ncbi:hypothetical protein GMORB2_7279 [Geosmithia morbida]|uniref:Glycosyltransferase 2-like domain-containing protein n=1 Tax=Geosmithia morbida TaxID=1094350 RepID=A0A9P4YUY6_9HYPO|nr:uncharacterized protein GMORB2_7279 [Geosmithia morbida]KAF4122287.1 hypothetical protein GMORB2_7279 [Geosmithia morbida]